MLTFIGRRYATLNARHFWPPTAFSLVFSGCAMEAAAAGAAFRLLSLNEKANLKLLHGRRGEGDAGVGATPGT